MGIRLAVDDFGTGYSSLSYLKQFPIDVLKIDRTFVDGLPDDKDDVALVEAIVAMAHSLNLQVVGEGVENDEQLSFLHSLGCDMIQGFHYSPPLSFDDFMLFLDKH
jgi:EAL domain-containing protein (putative c-di-GMP-specific phosphodiesterase class I)